MRIATCARTETSKLPTKVALLYGSLFYDEGLRFVSHQFFFFERPAEEVAKRRNTTVCLPELHIQFPLF